MENENFDKIFSILEEIRTNQKEILNSTEAAKYLSISYSQLSKLTSNNKITYSKPNGKLIYFKKNDLDNWLLQNTILATSDLESQVNKYLKG